MKIIVLVLLTVVAGWAFLPNQSSQLDKIRKSTRPLEKTSATVITVKPNPAIEIRNSEAIDEKTVPPLAQQISELEVQVASLEEQLHAVDFEKEMNSDLTSDNRRKELIHLVNRFTIAMGRLSQLEEQALDAEGVL